MQIVNRYVSWAKNETKPKAVIAYETMWGATEKMAKLIARGISDSGVDVKLYDVAGSDSTEIISRMLDARGYLLGSSTHDNDMLPNIAGFMDFLKGLKPKNRVTAAFGSFGWGGGAVGGIEKVLKEGGLEPVMPGISCKYFPDKDDEKKLYEFGVEFAKKIKG